MDFAQMMNMWVSDIWYNQIGPTSVSLRPYGILESPPGPPTQTPPNHLDHSTTSENTQQNSRPPPSRKAKIHKFGNKESL